VAQSRVSSCVDLNDRYLTRTLQNMDTEERCRLSERLDQLRAQSSARAQIETVARIVVDAPSEGHAISQIRALLGCSEVAARHVIMSPLSMYRRRVPDRLELEVAELVSALAL
jgi:hypothetical protein